MKLKCVNLVSTDPVRMKEFYSLVLQAPCDEIVPGRFEIQAENVTIVITPTTVKTPANPDCCGLEFLVEDVDAEYQRLREAGVVIENEPVTYPWGWRAIAMKDPDENNINFVQFVGR